MCVYVCVCERERERERERESVHEGCTYVVAFRKWSPDYESQLCVCVCGRGVEEGGEG